MTFLVSLLMLLEFILHIVTRVSFSKCKSSQNILWTLFIDDRIKSKYITKAHKPLWHPVPCLPLQIHILHHTFFLFSIHEPHWLSPCPLSTLSLFQLEKLYFLLLQSSISRPSSVSLLPLFKFNSDITSLKNPPNHHYLSFSIPLPCLTFCHSIYWSQFEVTVYVYLFICHPLGSSAWRQGL